MRRTLTFAAGLLLVLAASFYLVACGGNSSSAVTPTSPTGGGGGGSASVTVSITGINGSNSFSPNPVAVPGGQTVAWRNTDPTNTHHIVADNGSFDAGVTPPGATSAVVMPATGPISYHCSIHPSMVGSINGSTTPNPGSPY